MLALLINRRCEGWRLAPTSSLLAIIIFVAALALTCQDNALYAQSVGLKVIDTIVIDPGHGGSNEGARGFSKETLEKEEVLKIAFAVRDRLQKDYPNLRILLTRTEDVDVTLTDRIHLANAHEADIFFSLHLNSSTKPDASGVEVFYLRPDMSMPLVTHGDGSWGKDFKVPDATELPLFGPAETELPVILADLDRGSAHADSALVAEVLLSHLVRTGRKHANRGVRQANFGVLRGSRVPAVVVELGFLSNPEEERWFRKPQARTATAIAFSRALARIDRLFYRKSYASN